MNSPNDKMQTAPELTGLNVDPDPIKQFQRWFVKALDTEPVPAEVMTLATISADNHPEARIMLLRGFDDNGFNFFTNRNSPKGKELAANPLASMVFYWAESCRQVRISGRVSRIDNPELSQTYFKRRPRASQLAAWASDQSAVIDSFAELEAAVNAQAEKHRDKPVPCPPAWGGFRLTPTSIEFWQCRANRLHDRLRFTRTTDNSWNLERLSP